ncbi:MAG: hypothetical protein ABSH36_05385 [Solirubrobacteraceae bacterium]
MLRNLIMSKARALTAIAVLCVCLIAAGAAWAAETLEVTASFSPDKLGAPTNVHGTATIGSTSGPLPSPITEATVMGPAGLTVDTKGVGICNPVKLEQTLETSVCPKDSKAGFGGGMGAYEISHEVNEEPFTLNFYRGPNEDGHLVILAYLNAVSPVSVQLVLKAQVVNEPKPYGLGFSFKVPPIETLPGASNATAKSIYITLGAPNAAYYEKVGGKRKLVHVKGIVVPKTCPKGGFPYETQFVFEDGTTNTVKHTIPCPAK